MSLSDARLLTRLWLRAPLRIATAAPSGTRVCGALIADAAAAGPGWVVELGAGTGPVTAALLAAGVGCGRLLAVEANAELHARLCERVDPGLAARHDATDLPTLFDRRRIDRIAAVVSTLPILNMPKAKARAVLDGCFERAAPGASFTQITYLPGSPVSQRQLAAWGYSADIARFVWRNLPPATIWRYRRLPETR